MCGSCSLPHETFKIFLGELLSKISIQVPNTKSLVHSREKFLNSWEKTFCVYMKNSGVNICILNDVKIQINSNNRAHI